MAEQELARGSEPGVGNKVIATTLLESLAVRGLAAAHTRSLRALGLGEGGLVEATAWLPDEALGRMFVAADVDSALARSVGHRLMSPDATGLRLYSLGLATPEKAYRRTASLLPRPNAASRWTVDEIGPGSARISFFAGGTPDDDGPRETSLASNRRSETSLCALRIGMLEGVPGLFGLLPATVRHSTCLNQGGDACRYEVAWQKGSRIGLLVGSGIGAGLAAGIFALEALFGVASLPLAATILTAACVVVACVALGRSFDLTRQLGAVAGARRGHLALFDQVDDALASKLDALARVDAKLEGGEVGYSADRSLPATSDVARAGWNVGADALAAAREIHAAAGDLECWFEDQEKAEGIAEHDPDGAGRRRVRAIREQAERIVEVGSRDASLAQHSVDLVALVGRAVATARPGLPDSTVIHVEHEEDELSIVCEPVQIERVVIQLLRNAAEGSGEGTDPLEVSIAIRRVTRGVEFSIEGNGAGGIDSSMLDEVFDPFFEQDRMGIEEGFGLPACLRIVERHGGELRIDAEGRTGTRVFILLPESPE